MEKYYCCFKAAENEIVIERSKFIAYVREVDCDLDARNFIAEIRKKHSLATHNTYAYIAERGAVSRFSDDGEPQGTAGAPILEAIKASELKNTAVVVTRYFGGVKLGTGGLARAYFRAADEAIKLSGRAENIPSINYKINLNYDKLKPLTSLCEKLGSVLETDYSSGVSLTSTILAENEKTFLSALAELFSGKADLEMLGEAYYRKKC